MGSIIRLMPRDPDTGMPPEWLRGITSHEQFPRMDTGADRNFVFPISQIPQTIIAERVAFIVENCAGPWACSIDGFHFAWESDACLYRLRYGEAFTRGDAPTDRSATDPSTTEAA